MKHLVAFILYITCLSSLSFSQSVYLKNATIIDGTGNAPLKNANLFIKDGWIQSVGKDHTKVAADVQVIDASGKTIIPLLLNTHGHLGTLKGTTTIAENYTRENILRQLKKYESYGVGAVLSMGTDRPLMFEGLRDSSRKRLLPGAMIFSAGYGFGVPNGAPPMQMGMDRVFRPATAAEVPAMIKQLADLKVDVVKMWVDDFGGSFIKMKPEIYTAIIKEAHQHGLRVASHLYYLEDARKLVQLGVDIIAHSIRDQEIDDALIAEMKKHKVTYIPTLSLDEYAYIYASQPSWINDPFFKASLEPGVYEMITSKDYQDKLKNSPAFAKNMKAFETTLKNVKKIADAGIFISLGTDSGATPVRAQGFSEHLELELLVKAGLTPLQAITIATGNASKVLHINNEYGTLEKDKRADFMLLKEDPLTDIKYTRSIDAVWKNGIKVSSGPLAGE